MNTREDRHEDGEQDERHRDNDHVDQERDHAARQHALEQFRLGGRIVGVRLHIDAEADPLWVVPGHAHSFTLRKKCGDKRWSARG